MFFACNFIFAGLLAQKPNIDSLVKVAEGKEDTGKVLALLKLAEIRSRQNPSLGLEYCTQAISLSEKLNFSRGLARGYFHYGQGLDYLGNYQGAMASFIQALEVLSQTGDSLDIAKVLTNMGVLYNNLDNAALAKEHHLRAEGIFTRRNSPRGIFMTRNNLAMTYSDEGDYQTALKLYFRNLKMTDSVPLPAYRGPTFNNIGFSYLSLNEPARALEYFNQSYQLKKESKDEYGLTNTCTNMGLALLKLGRFPEAEEKLKEALDYCRKVGARDREIETLLVWYQLEKARGNYSKALAWMEQSNSLRDSLELVDQKNKTANLQIAYESQKVRDQVRYLNKEKQLLQQVNQAHRENADRQQRQKWILTGVLVLLAGLAVMLGLNYRKIRAQKETIQQANLALINKNDELKEINQEKDALIGVVAHDLRAPLNRSVALAQLVQAMGPLNEEQQKYIEMINQVGEAGGRLIQDLLEISAYQQGYLKVDIKSTSLKDLLAALLQGYMKPAEAKGIQLRLDLTEDVVVNTDPDLLTRMLDNLVSNALKFTKPHQQKRVQVKLTVAGDNLSVSVMDQGPGISAEDIPRLFRKFQRLSNRPTAGESSTGLGLAIVKILAEKMGYELAVNSQPGIGSEFRIIIPSSALNRS